MPTIPLSIATCRLLLLPWCVHPKGIMYHTIEVTATLEMVRHKSPFQVVTFFVNFQEVALSAVTSWFIYPSCGGDVGLYSQFRRLGEEFLKGHTGPSSQKCSQMLGNNHGRVRQRTKYGQNWWNWNDEKVSQCVSHQTKWKLDKLNSRIARFGRFL